MYHYVYQITNLLNGMIYVGKRSSKKHPGIDPYFGSGVRLRHAIKKYGKESFKKDVIAIVDSAEEAEELEEIIVDAEFIARKDTYNMIVGGQKGTRGLIFSDETRAKISEANKGKTLSEEHRAKLTGRTISEEQKAKISEAQSGKEKSEEHKTKISEAMKGKEISDETRAKLSEAHKGKKRKPFSEETKAKMSAAHKGKKYSSKKAMAAVS